MSVMYLKAKMPVIFERRERGFTLIEVLVVIVIVGIIGASIGPNLFNLLSAYNRQNEINSLKGSLASLPVATKLQNKPQLISTPSDLGLPIVGVFTPHLRIEANGFCHSSTLELQVDDNLMRFDVLSPYCELQQTKTQ